MNTKNKPNGRGALLAKGSGANGGTISLSGMGRAASVDATELSGANAAASSAVGAERETYADVAQVQGKGKRFPAAGTASRRNGKAPKTADQVRREVPPASEPLPIDGEACVDAVHRRVELVRVEGKRR